MARNMRPDAVSIAYDSLLFCCEAISCPKLTKPRMRTLQRLQMPLGHHRSLLTFRHLLFENLFKGDISKRLHVVLPSHYGAIPGLPHIIKN